MHQQHLLAIYITLHTAMKPLIKSYEPHMILLSHPSLPHHLAPGCTSTLLCPPKTILSNIDLMWSPAGCSRSITLIFLWALVLRLHYHPQHLQSFSQLISPLSHFIHYSLISGCAFSATFILPLPQSPPKQPIHSDYFFLNLPHP